MDVAERLKEVEARVAAAAARAGRDPGDVTIIAVSKGFDADALQEAVAAGVANLGENRADELAAKSQQVSDVVWHFIGRLQTNKVRKIVGVARYLHSVDRLSLIEELDRRAQAAESELEVLIEVNVSGEQSKAGVGPDGVQELAERCIEAERLQLVGLMTIAPLGPAEQARPHFRRLAETAAEVRRTLDHPGIRHLSMGMSQDYEVAVEEGATMVRIGEAIFGPRPRALKG